jgi:hypothetical protein
MLAKLVIMKYIIVISRQTHSQSFRIAYKILKKWGYGIIVIHACRHVEKCSE